MKGKHNSPKWPGYSKTTIHYEISGAGRIDYQYNPASTVGAEHDVHGVVKILTVDLGSHCEAPPAERVLANILPTDFGLQGPAETVKPVLRIAKALVSGLLR